VAVGAAAEKYLTDDYAGKNEWRQMDELELDLRALRGKDGKRPKDEGQYRTYMQHEHCPGFNRAKCKRSKSYECDGYVAGGGMKGPG
jgi:hypothetical protein